MGFGTVLKKAFPFISAAASLGGPIGMMAANAVGAALGIDKVTPTEDGIGSAIAAAQIKDPDALVKLQQAEQDFKIQMAKLGFDDAEKLEEIAAGDRANARAREAAVKDNTPKRLAYIVIFTSLIGQAALVWMVFKWGQNMTAVIAAILGDILGMWKSLTLAVGYYYYGSSSGSEKKNDTIQQALSQQGTK